MPKKTIYVREADLALWERAEALSQDDSVSAVLTEALQQYLEGQRALVGAVILKGASAPIHARISPVSAGWMVAVAPGPEGRSVLEALSRAGLGTGVADPPGASAAEQLWVWVPADRITAIWLTTPRAAGGADYTTAARQAWGILTGRARSGDTIAYGALGAELGGLHPLRQVPQVLGVVERWCLDQGVPDLTAVVVGKESGLPGRDFFRQNGWLELPLAEQVDRWRQTKQAIQAYPWPADPPF